jgi:membrane associated rhomboid family serine protease
MYVLSAIGGIDKLVFANIPLFVVYRLELYRIFLAPWFELSIFSLLVIWLSFQNIGKKLEEALGSAGFLIVIFTLASATNILWVMLCISFEFSGISPGAMKEPSVGFWPVILGLIVLECSLAPGSTRRLFPFNVEVPVKYYPWALLAMFALFFGISVVHLLAVGVGYLYTDGYLELIKPDESWVTACESGGLSGAAQQEGFIPHSAALFPSVGLRGHNTTTGVGSSISALFTASASAAASPLPFTQVKHPVPLDSLFVV